MALPNTGTDGLGDAIDAMANAGMSPVGDDTAPVLPDWAASVYDGVAALAGRDGWALAQYVPDEERLRLHLRTPSGVIIADDLTFTLDPIGCAMFVGAVEAIAIAHLTTDAVADIDALDAEEV